MADAAVLAGLWGINTTICSLLSHSGDKKLTPDISFWQDYFRMIYSSQHSSSIPFDQKLFPRKGLRYFWTARVFFLGLQTDNWIQFIPNWFLGTPPKKKLSDFWCVKIILRWQNMFYKSGEVISDQFNHLILIQNLENSEKNWRKQEVLENTFFDDFPHWVGRRSQRRVISQALISQRPLFQLQSKSWQAAVPSQNLPKPIQSLVPLKTLP